MAFLTKNLRIIIKDLRVDPIIEKMFYYEGELKNLLHI